MQLDSPQPPRYLRFQTRFWASEIFFNPSKATPRPPAPLPQRSFFLNPPQPHQDALSPPGAVPSPPDARRAPSSRPLMGKGEHHPNMGPRGSSHPGTGGTGCKNRY